MKSTFPLFLLTVLLASACASFLPSLKGGGATATLPPLPRTSISTTLSSSSSANAAITAVPTKPVSLSLSPVPVATLKPPSAITTLKFTPTDFNTIVQKTYNRYPLTITRGSGAYLYDDLNDKKYLDFVAGIATCALGHNHAKLTAAIKGQMDKVHHISNLYYTPECFLLAKWLTDNSIADKVFFCNSGAEANEAAIKLSRRHSYNRGITDPIIISAKDSFHGRTLGALSATMQPKYHKGFTYGGQMMQGFVQVNYNDSSDLQRLVKKYSKTPLYLRLLGRKRGVSGIMLETLQGEGGIKPGAPEFFATARKLCDETGALLTCDEVQVGMGRSGKLWGYDNLGVKPDIFTSAKALGGGIPIGAMMACGDCKETLGPGDHASTFGGNPLACAAGLAVASAFTEEQLLVNVNARSMQIKSRLADIRQRHPSVLTEIRGWGLLLGVELSADCGFLAGELVAKCMERGLLLVPAGLRVVRFVPPLNVKEKEIEEGMRMFEEGIVDMVKAVEEAKVKKAAEVKEVEMEVKAGNA